MDQEQTLTLYRQGAAAWNKWANERLEEKEKLLKSGKWKIERDENYDLISKNEETKTWLKKSEANFTTRNVPIHFTEIMDFTDFIFPSHVCFNNATFDDDCKFENVKFLGDTDFINTEFNGLSWFDGTNFFGHVNFDSSTFKGETSFTKAKFYKYTCMSNVNFNGITWFDETLFREHIAFNCSVFEKFTRFKNAQFLEQADLAAMKVKSSFSLENSSFHYKIPELIQASFTEAPRLDNIKFGHSVPPGNFINSITTFIHPDIKAKYQALKRLAIQAHDHENEQRFWAGELRSDRSLRTKGGGWSLSPLVSAYWWINIAYGCVSNYGRSIVRPMMALAILLVIMTFLHLSFHLLLLKEEVSKFQNTTNNFKQFQIKDCNAESAAYRLATKNLAIGTLRDPSKRNTFKRDYNCLYGTYNDDNQTPKIPALILIAEFLQTLFSAICIFLALLGIRNNFKMK